MDDNIDNNEKGGVKLFGRDVSKIPCFRNTFLFSISSGFGVGLAHFMFTSKVKKSCNIAVVTYVMTTLTYWSYCRYNYSVMKFKLNQLPNEVLTKELNDAKKSDC